MSARHELAESSRELGTLETVTSLPEMHCTAQGGLIMRTIKATRGLERTIANFTIRHTHGLRSSTIATAKYPALWGHRR